MCGVLFLTPIGYGAHWALKARRRRAAQRFLRARRCERYWGSSHDQGQPVEKRGCYGDAKKEIIRCLKRFIAREVYRALLERAAPPLPALVSALDEP